MKSDSIESRQKKSKSKKQQQSETIKKDFDLLPEKLQQKTTTIVGEPVNDDKPAKKVIEHDCAAESPILTKIKIYSLFLLLLYMAVHFRRDDNLWSSMGRIKGNLWPLERLLNYKQFKERYPRIVNLSLNKRPFTEDSRRFLIFNQDLISLAKHNVAYILGKQSYYMRQSPFKSDRTNLEQMDVLNQLDEFNLAQILEASRMQDAEGQQVSAPKADSIKFKSPYVKRNEDGKATRRTTSSFSSTTYDRPVRGVPSSAELEKSNNVNRWLKRLVKGDEYFEIPNFPLDQQPDPSRVTHIDSDLRDCSGEIKDQGSCGACYAFSWISYVEWHYCKQSGGQKLDFSEQHIVDCGHKAKLGGCVEGLLKNAQAFSQVFGLVLERDYPYRKKQGQCKREQGDIQIKSQLTRIKVDRAEWEQVLKEQPILLEVHLPSDILAYSRGVHPGLNCNANLGHGMLLVGYGSQEGKPYWLLKNSMGKHWGENGYLRLSREAPMKECFATGFVFKIKFKSLNEEQYNQFYDSIQFEPTVQPEETKIINNDLMKWLDA